MARIRQTGAAAAAIRQPHVRRAGIRRAGVRETGNRQPEAVPLFRPTIRRRQMHAVLECLVSEAIGPGALARRLVRELAVRLGLLGGAAMADEGAALGAALEAVTAGDEQGDGRGPGRVLMSALVPYGYVRAARRLGLTPVLVEVDPDSGTLCLDRLRRLAATEPEQGPKPVALVVHHPLGQTEPLDVLRELGLPMVEDVTSTALGAVSDAGGGRVSTREVARSNGAGTGSAAGGDSPPALPTAPGRAGEVVVMALAPEGAITAAAGALVLARRRRLQRFLADYPAARGCTELADMNAALTLAQLPELADYRRRCAHLATLFRDALARSRHRTLAPAPAGDGVAAAAAPGQLFPVVVADGMPAVRRYASRHRVETALAFDGCAVAQVAPEPGAPDSAATEPFDLHAAADLARRCILFPMHPTLSDAAAGQIARVLATLP